MKLASRFGFKIEEQNIENKNDSIHARPSLIIIRAFTIHTKDFTLPRPTSISQCLLWAAGSTLYQAPPRRLLKVTALQDRVQVARPVGRVLLGVYVAALDLGLFLHGIQSSLDRILHQKAYCTRKKGSHHSA